MADFPPAVARDASLSVQWQGYLSVKHASASSNPLMEENGWALRYFVLVGSSDHHMALGTEKVGVGTNVPPNVKEKHMHVRSGFWLLISPLVVDVVSCSVV